MDLATDLMQATDLWVSTQRLQDYRLESRPLPNEGSLAPGKARLKIDRFGLSANNITYAVLGEAYGYWKYFPAPEGWGRIPVWGYADVIESASPLVSVGERFWGIFPMASHVLLEPTEATPQGFIDDAAHRRGLRRFYNSYTRVPGGPAQELAENLQLLLRPLFMTALMLHDYLADNAWFGAETLLITSASSKLALAVAQLAAAEGRELIGLTSPAHLDFVRRHGAYDRVYSYAELERLPASRGVTLVDIAGDAGVGAAARAHFGPMLKHDAMVGFSHWDKGGYALRGGRTPFFVLDRVDLRMREWGPAGLQERFMAAWGPLCAATTRWLQIDRADGAAQVARRYDDLVNGRSAPTVGYVLSL